MTRLRILLLVVLVVVAGCFGPPPGPGPRDAYDRGVAGEINNLRARYGRPQFGWDPYLAARAQAHADWMLENASREHSPGDHDGEITYWNFDNGACDRSPNEPVEWWEGSPSHLGAMAYTSSGGVGVGSACGIVTDPQTGWTGTALFVVGQFESYR